MPHCIVGMHTYLIPHTYLEYLPSYRESGEALAADILLIWVFTRGIHHLNILNYGSECRDFLLPTEEAYGIQLPNLSGGEN